MNKQWRSEDYLIKAKVHSSGGGTAFIAQLWMRSVTAAEHNWQECMWATGKPDQQFVSIDEAFAAAHSRGEELVGGLE